MNSKVTVTEQGRTHRISWLDVMLGQLGNDAMRGNQRALKLLMESASDTGQRLMEPRTNEMTSEDLEILSDYLQKTGASNSDPDGGSHEGDDDDDESL